MRQSGQRGGWADTLLRGQDEEVLYTLRSAGFDIIGASAKGTSDFYRTAIISPAALVIGNETDGIRDGVRRACTRLARIPKFPSQSSLNVAVASGIPLYELVRIEWAPPVSRVT